MPVRSFADLAAALAKIGKGGARIAFKSPVVNADAFSRFCEIAYTWGMLEPCTIIAEELADVTTPGKAPPGWGALVRGGLKYGIHILAITQSPSESDKTIMRNAGVIRCFRMQRFDDRRYMAKEMDISLDIVNSLEPLEYVEIRPCEPGSAPVHAKITF